MSGALERVLITEVARHARVPLFDEGHIAPAGALKAVANLIRTLRLNRVRSDQFVRAGGDARAADAYERFERRRQEFGFVDETDRIDALLRVGIPALDLVIEDPSFPHRAAWDLYSAAIAAASSCRIGVSTLADDGSAPSWVTRLGELGFDAVAVSTVPSLRPAQLGDDLHMRAIGGIGAHGEVELVAREMLALLRAENGVRPSDILGIAPNSHYLSLLNDACNRLGIPVASPRRRDAADVPLVRALLESFRLLADSDYDTTERGLALLATPYLGLSLARLDRFSRTLLLSGVGSLRSWHRFAQRAHGRKFNHFASAVAPLAMRLEGERAPKELAATLRSLGLDYGFVSSGRRVNLAAGRDAVLRLDQLGWNALNAATDELNEALRQTGVTRITARRWLSQLNDVVAGTPVRMDAKAYDGVHLTIAGAGLPSADHVFAVGWREGMFPRRTREDPLLSERVKKTLNAQGAMLPVATDRTRQEVERRDRIRRAARTSLTVSWPSMGEDGEERLPSFYMDDLRITDRSTRSVGDTTWPLPLAVSRGERLARATLIARHHAADTVGPELDLVRDALSKLTSVELQSYEGARHAGQVIELHRDVLDEARPMAARMSASQARMVVHCLYEHFGKRRLALEPLVAPQLDQLVLGSIAHGVLADVGRSGFDPASIPRALEQWWAEKIPRALHDDPRVIFEHDVLTATLTALVTAERAHLDTCAGHPAHFELSFGTSGGSWDPSSLAIGLDIALPSGTTPSHSTLRGAIDRVDVLDRDGVRYGVATDYKSGTVERYGKQMEEMEDFQLPIYCEVLPLFGIEPVGAVYLGIAGGERYGVVRSDFANAFIPGEAKGVKRMAPEEFTAYMRQRQAALRSEIARLARGELTVKPRNADCGYCDLRPVCRIGTFGVGGASAAE